MPYEPAVPATNAELTSLMFRNQFQGLATLIAAVPSIAAQVDGVSTLNPGDPAAVTITVNGTTMHLTFAIPRGNDGAPGEVTNAQLASAITTAISGTSSNSNAVALECRCIARAHGERSTITGRDAGRLEQAG